MYKPEIINLDEINWSGLIIGANKPYNKTCYKIGGLLSYAVLWEIKPEDELVKLVNQCLQMEPEKKECLTRGYLYWRFSGRNIHNIRFRTNSKTELNSFPPVVKLLAPLNDKLLEFVLLLLNNYYVYQLLSSECKFFKRCWSVIKKNGVNPFFAEIKSQIFYGIQSRMQRTGIKKMIMVMSNNQLKNWLSGDLKINLMDNLPNKEPIFFANEHDVIQQIGQKIMQDDLVRMWNIMRKVWRADRLESLGCSFLEGIQTRMDKESGQTGELIKNIESIVKNTIASRKNISMFIQHLNTEFSTHNPFTNWGRKRNDQFPSWPKAVNLDNVETPAIERSQDVKYKK